MTLHGIPGGYLVPPLRQAADFQRVAAASSQVHTESGGASPLAPLNSAVMSSPLSAPPRPVEAFVDLSSAKDRVASAQSW